MEKLENRIKENGKFYTEISDDEIVSEEFEDELNETTKDLQINEIKEVVFSKFIVFFYFTIKNRGFVFRIKSDLFNINKQYAYELIQNIVKKINEKNIIINCEKSKYIISLKDIDDYKNNNNKDFYINNYELKQCNKKNFIPNPENQSFSSETLLKNINNKRISFIARNPLNIMLREKEETELEEGNNKYQNYFDDEI